jgi:hypothetical protein
MLHWACVLRVLPFSLPAWLQLSLERRPFLPEPLSLRLSWQVLPWISWLLPYSSLLNKHMEICALQSHG